MAVPPDVALIITRKKAQYGRFADCKQWDQFEKLALPDAEFGFYDTDGSPLRVGNTPLVFTSAKPFAAFFSKFFKNAQTLHNFGPGDLELTAPGEVKAIWALEDQLLLRGTAGLVELRGGGHYYETWVERDGDWFIKKLDMRRTYTKLSILGRLLFLLVAIFGISLV